MGQKVTNFKAVVRYPIRYRFTCENCGCSTGWLIHEFAHEEQLTLSGHDAYLSSVQEKDLNAKAQKELRNKVDSAIHDCQSHRYPFDDACPSCKKHQSWGIRKLYIYLFMVPGSVAVSLFFILWLVSSFTEVKYAVPIILAGMGASLIGTFIYILIRKAQVRGVVNRQLPEIDWGI